MSGPVFVRDAQGTPLMPMAAAHARALLARGTAQRVPHHAFTIIQLARSYAHPVVRPVLLHITIQWRTILLLLLVEQRGGVRPLLLFLTERRAGWFHHIQPYRGHTWANSTTDTTQQPLFPKHVVHTDHHVAKRLSRLIMYLRTLVPLSHVVVDITDPQQHVLNTLVDDVALSRLQLTVLSPSTRPYTLSPLLAATMGVARQRNWDFLPRFYASTTYTHTEDSAHTTVSTTPSRRVIRSRFAIPNDLLIVCHDGHHLQRGLYIPWRESQPPIILVPTASDPTHIVWQWNVLPRTSTCWLLQTNGVIFLPIGHGSS